MLGRLSLRPSSSMAMMSSRVPSIRGKKEGVRGGKGLGNTRKKDKENKNRKLDKRSCRKIFLPSTSTTHITHITMFLTKIHIQYKQAFNPTGPIYFVCRLFPFSSQPPRQCLGPAISLVLTNTVSPVRACLSI